MILRKAMYWLVVPGLAILGVLLVVVISTWTVVDRVGAAEYLIFGAGGAVLFVSMSINAWHVLRHLANPTERTLPLRVAVSQALLYAAIATWLVAVVAERDHNDVGPAVALSVPIAAISIVILTFVRESPREN